MKELTDKNAEVNDGKAAMLTSKHRLTICFVSIILINWFSNYYLFQNFGLYIDDYFRIPKIMVAMEEGIPEILATIFSSPLNVRPIHGGLIYALSFIGLTIGGISGIYFIGFIVLSINALLCFSLINLVIRNTLTAFIGALAFVLYPVTTMKVWITAALGIQPAITMVLLSFILYLRERKFTAYILVTISLFCYETLFWVFISAPLLRFPWNRNRFKKLVLHGVILALIFCLFFVFKTTGSDPRLQNNGMASLMLTSIKHIVQGPLYNLLGHLKIVVKTGIAMKGYDPYILIFSTLFFFSIIWVIGNRKENLMLSGDPYKSQSMADAVAAIIKNNDNNLKLLLIGAVMLLFAYPLSFNGNVKTIYGIGSRLHLAGAIGIAFFFAGVGALFVDCCDKINRRKIGRLLLSLAFSMLALYNFQIQQDYRDAKRIQSQFWKELINLHPGFERRPLIFFDQRNAKKVRSLTSFDWSTSFVLEHLYDFATDEDNEPRVYVLKKPGLERVLNSSNDLTLSDIEEMHFINLLIPSDMERSIEKENSMIVYYKDNNLVRIKNTSEKVDAANTLQKKTASKQTSYSKGVLYDLLIDNV